MVKAAFSGILVQFMLFTGLFFLCILHNLISIDITLAYKIPTNSRQLYLAVTLFPFRANIEVVVLNPKMINT